VDGTFRPLNPVLYERLNREFGSVHVANEGDAYVATSYVNVRGQRRTDATSYGEYYRICCPFCQDTRHRLWVNHMYGMYEAATGARNTHLAICYNETGCLGHPSNRQKFEYMVYQGLGRNQRQSTNVRRGRRVAECLSESDPPGSLIPLNMLNPGHVGLVYLEERGCNLRELNDVFHISYCEAARHDYPMATNRLVAPIYMRGMMVGWQCRYIGEVNWSNTGIPKYYTKPRMPKRLMLYNFDMAKNYSLVVITEGITDVWAVGPQGVALLGKRLHPKQMELLVDTWRNGTVVVMLDSDASDTADTIVSDLQRTVLGDSVVPVYLPPGKDPADFDRTVLWDMIATALERNGLQIVQEEPNEVSDDGRAVPSASQ
jgi:hypothetical protein